MADVEDFAAVAGEAVRAAGTLIRARWREQKTVHYKSAVDLVTDTDRDAESLIVTRLQQAFPDHLIVAEEASAAGPLIPPPPERFVWYLDPLDGTTNFAHAYPQFCVSLALACGTELRHAIVLDPVREETFMASRGGGATLNGAPIHVAPTAELNGALLGTGFPYDRRVHADFYLRFVSDFMTRAQGIRRSGSAALDLCYVACGRLDGFWEWKLKPWDTAAGTLIIREAGGMVTDFRGGAFNLYGEQTVASNGPIHAAMLSVLTTRLDAT
jgi:myo-inositol-1(or 4)-monophosphatase